MTRTQILVVGVGGQGVLTCAQILGAAADAQGLHVVVGQLHGMSQRGGSVQCTVVLGQGAQSSMLCLREADVVIAFEPIEALRALVHMGPATRVVTSRTMLVPFDAVYRNEPPLDVDRIVVRLREVARDVRAVDTQSLVGAVGETRTLNVVMLGIASGLRLLPIDERALLDAVRARCGDRFFEANGKAFALGKSAEAS